MKKNQGSNMVFKFDLYLLNQHLFKIINERNYLELNSIYKSKWTESRQEFQSIEQVPHASANNNRCGAKIQVQVYWWLSF